MALAPEEEVGRISTRSAGAAEFRATLSWRRPEDMPQGPIVPGPSEITAVKFNFVEAEDLSAAQREMIGEVRAFSERDLGSALEDILRSVTSAAALAEAVLETRVVRISDPRTAPAAAVEILARDLWEAGLQVSFGPSWTPAFGADISLGCRGAEEDLLDFLRAHPRWEIDSRPR